MVRVRALEGTRTPNSGCIWLAECEAEGRHFEARSRHSAPNALARELMAGGISDRPMEVYYTGLVGCVRWGSVAAAAKRTFTEGNRSLQCIRWIAPQEAREAIRADPKQGVKQPAPTVPPQPEARAA